MRTLPILMSAPMVRALLDGRKTQTRRIMKLQSEFQLKPGVICRHLRGFGPTTQSIKYVYGEIGDLLWVRESLQLFNTVHTETGERGLSAYYAAGGGDMQTWDWNGRSDTVAIPSIHMPKTVSRLTLEITDVRPDLLQNISEEDARDEGTPPMLSTLGERDDPKYVDGYRQIWEAINGIGSWDKNPFVWVITFKVHRKNIDARLQELKLC